MVYSAASANEAKVPLSFQETKEKSLPSPPSHDVVSGQQEAELESSWEDLSLSSLTTYWPWGPFFFLTLNFLLCRDSNDFLAGPLRKPEEKNVKLSVKFKALCKGVLFPSLTACLSFLSAKWGYSC